ncbi:NAD(P)-dependent alcohol dehydrogenase [Pseudoroseicyclus tamaricis]|uniref:NAD(P)-dependent alcohol dehydrogenase n=1 Tax=Pseudoroseicyclus tamaricis TaxID=2705421 RepID=A0A6B2JT99_9RHOB|nr:NAD(P)-dependent alcohol dehydrogenase [Pseudoroseicyclus tamaricis]NDU99393.1 NAD(P)-dependent alcohol dehydrogenase [Pseudoroseicyclus tamaricis]
MKALKVTAYGGPDVLALTDAPRPTPKAGEILIRNVASPVSQADVMMRAGTPRAARLMLGLRRPRAAIPGTGFAGRVVEVGPGVTAFAPGDAVFGETALGFATHAEYVAVPADGLVMPLPPGLDFQAAAPLCDGALTSWNFLYRLGEMTAGQRVLINGASGSLGTMAVQIARDAGAHVTAVCSGKNAALVRRLGADEVIDYHAADFWKEGARYDIVFDTVGKVPFRRARRALRPGGRYLSPVLDLGLMLATLTSRLGRRRAMFQATGLQKHEVLRPMLAEMTAMAASGALTTVIDRVYPLAEASAAHAHVEAGHKVGNVVLSIAAAESDAAAA